MAEKESLDNQIDKKAIDPSAAPVLKSAKNMVGYADDKEIDPKLLKVGELIRAEMEEDIADATAYKCSDDDIMECQEKREKALAKQRLESPNT